MNLCRPALLSLLLLFYGLPTAWAESFDVKIDFAGKAWPADTRGDPALVTHARDSTGGYVRFHAPEVPKSAIIDKSLAVPQGTRTLVLTARVRSKGVVKGSQAWHCANVQLVFLDADKKQVGGWPPRIAIEGDNDWQERTQQYDVPPGAKTAKVSMGLWDATGTFDVAHVIAKFANDGQGPATQPKRLAWDFQPSTAGDWPEGFSRGDPSWVSLASDGENRYLRLSRATPGAAIVTNKLALNKDWPRLSVRFRMRVAGLKPGEKPWENAQGQVSFLDAEGKQVGGWPPRMETLADTDWKALTRVFDVPAGAATMNLSFGLWNCVGTLDVDDVVIEPEAAGQLPPSVPLTWGAEPTLVDSATRGSIVLNGPWRFMPSIGDTSQEPPAGNEWGWIRVPASWTAASAQPGIIARGTCSAWNSFVPAETAAAWYERELTVPREWAGRALVLQLDRVSTDAIVYVDGKRAGEVTWPRGEVDLTQVVTPGVKSVLRVKVLATDDEKTVLDFMGTADSQVSQKKAVLESRGLIGDVRLLSKPKGLHVSDVFVRPSTRNKSLTVEVTLSDALKSSTPIELIARLRAPDGTEEIRFTQRVTPEMKAGRTLVAEWTWANPRLWDVGKPELYRLLLSAKSPGALEDEVSVTFGFREFWIEGRDFYLNGTKIRLRPVLAPTQWNHFAGTSEVIRGNLNGMLESGFNLAQVWPVDDTRRGVWQFWNHWYAEADRIGILIAGVAPSINRYIVDGSFKYTWSDRRESWERVVRAELPRVRNHPSVVMWGTSANFFGDKQDQNPLHIGRRVFENTKNRAAGKAGVAFIKQIDPTRPVFTHHGADVGDLHTMNTYLGLLPLQERIQWLSHYKDNGEIPYFAVEMGTPLFTNFHRGRNGFGGAVQSEPLWPEHLATYLGPEAYAHETPLYRREIIRRFKQGQAYESWHAGNEFNVFSPTFQKLNALFIRDTWRAWRAAGITGGMLPWDYGYAWQNGPSAREEVDVGPFAPGRLGHYPPFLTKGAIERFANSSVTQLTPSGHALLAANGPTLAYIAGAPIHTDARHQYYIGAAVEKQIALLNDTRAAAAYRYTWTAFLNGQRIAGGSGTGRLDPAETKLDAVRFVLPDTLAAPKVDGTIVLEADIAGVTHRDTFAIRVYEAAAKAQDTVAIIDPVGKTRGMLERSGYTTKQWSGEAAPVLIVGREAFSNDPTSAGSLVARIEAYVRNGGRAIIFAQHPKYLEQYLGLRVAPYVSRRVYAVNERHSVINGLDSTDLRDWSGASTLIDPRPAATAPDVALGAHGLPRYGWRWGNEGMVTAAPIEKPHHAGWRAILQCEFDLAWSPLLELDFGRGRVSVCQLELEDNASSTPAADLLLRRVMTHVSTAPLQPRASRTVALGLAADEVGLLTSVGLQYTTLTSADDVTSNDLILVGREWADEAALTGKIDAGAKAVVLPRRGSGRVLGADMTSVESFSGSYTPPDWPQTMGLGISDLRYRTDTPAIVITGGEGVEVGANGLLARRNIGRGQIVFYQGDPTALNADEKTHLRLTRWRLTRSLVQVLANCGAAFAGDQRLFRPHSLKSDVVSLVGPWKAKWIKRIEDPTGEAEHEDPGMSDAAKELLSKNTDDAAWETLQCPGAWDETAGGKWANANGEAVMRRVVQVPAHLAGQDLILSLGAIDDRDVTTFNGMLVGQSPPGTDSQWDVKRQYVIPASLVKAGKENVIAIRVWDRFRTGGMAGPGAEMSLSPKPRGETIGLYHADYRDDFELGDDPFRYYRW